MAGTRGSRGRGAPWYQANRPEIGVPRDRSPEASARITGQECRKPRCYQHQGLTALRSADALTRKFEAVTVPTARTRVAPPSDPGAIAHARVPRDNAAATARSAASRAGGARLASRSARVAACGDPLGNPAKSAATAGQPGYGDPKWRHSRRGRFDARKWLAQVTNLGRVAWCGHASRTEDGSVSLKYDGDTAGLGGLVTCGSLWACPVCSAKITSCRTSEVEQALQWNADRGGSVALLTLTMRHHQGQRLKTLWDALSQAWRYMTSGRAWKERRKELGVDHYIRATEVTYGDNGWHVHAHILLLFDGLISEQLVDTWADELYGRWSSALGKVGLEASREHGVDLRTGQAGLDRLARYLNKLTYEAVGGRFKAGRKGGRTPFEVLHDAIETGLYEDFRVWWEWERASKGRRQLVWSDGLKAEVGIGVVTDEEIAAEEIDGDTIAILPPQTWKAIRDDVADLLEVTETWGVGGAYAWLAHRGLRWRTPHEPPSYAELH